MDYVVKPPACTLQLIDDKIVYADFTVGGEITLPEMIQIYDEIEKIGGGKRVGMLTTFKNFIPPKEEVMEYAASERPARLIFASAIVIKSLAMRLVLNLYMQFFNKKKPIRKIFNNKTEAIAWLKKMQIAERKKTTPNI